MDSHYGECFLVLWYYSYMESQHTVNFGICCGIPALTRFPVIEQRFVEHFINAVWPLLSEGHWNLVSPHSSCTVVVCIVVPTSGYLEAFLWDSVLCLSYTKAITMTAFGSCCETFIFTVSVYSNVLTCFSYFLIMYNVGFIWSTCMITSMVLLFAWYIV